MGYSVSTQGFEGPFDLLLQLVARQKVDIGAVSVSDIAGQYLDEVRRMGDLDLEVASDFVLVASTLLYLKAVSLAPSDEPTARADDDELGELSADELRDVLVARLVAYRTFRGAALSLGARAEAEGHMHARTAGPGPEFSGLMPDYLEGVPLPTLATICAKFLARRETFLLESEHIAAKRIPLEVRVEQVDRIIRSRGHMTFTELLDGDVSVEGRVVNFLALLELYKRNSVRLTQEELFGAILIDPVEGARAFIAAENAGELSSAGEVAADGGDAPGEQMAGDTDGFVGEGR
ncbi:MAG: segregation/condensation protein A [Coriobacteriia bacterium]|nr:segregation/condensation protein A [Coriobacteriia bacterium]MBS5478255.1 segregation/condensation protein A [Coriobacteriia bacterium]